MTKSSSGGTRTRSRKQTVDRMVRMVFRRKVCLSCFIVSLILFALLLAGAIALTVLTVGNWHQIGIYVRKQALLRSRSDIEAFFEIECSIYNNSKLNSEWSDFDLQFCNRYCERNQMFEFMYRQVDPNSTYMDKSKGSSSNMFQCPIYVEFKPCQTEEGGHCEEKIFNEEFITLEMGEMATTFDEHLVGACFPCGGKEDLLVS